MKLTSADRAELLSLIDLFPRQRIVLLGDLVADEFIHGEIARVSREAPVLILKQREKQIVPGGGANAANNLAALGAKVLAVGVVGDDESGEALLGSFRDRGISTGHVLQVRGHVTPTKSRVLGGVSHWQRQQIVRVDREPLKPLDPQIRRRLAEKAVSLLARASGALISDYGYGSTNARDVARLRAGRRKPSVPITVDSRFDLVSYSGVTAATPNEPEVEQAFGRSIGANRKLLHELGWKLLRRMKLSALLVTRGRKGMVLFEPRHAPQYVEVFGSNDAVDVTGAGDTVIAAFTLALAAGANFLRAAQLANCAGGLVVMKRGTATVSAAELREAIRNA